MGAEWIPSPQSRISHTSVPYKTFWKECVKSKKQNKQTIQKKVHTFKCKYSSSTDKSKEIKRKRSLLLKVGCGFSVGKKKKKKKKKRSELPKGDAIIIIPIIPPPHSNGPIFTPHPPALTGSFLSAPGTSRVLDLCSGWGSVDGPPSCCLRAACLARSRSDSSNDTLLAAFSFLLRRRNSLKPRLLRFGDASN